jgi:hypothetical protein
VHSAHCELAVKPVTLPKLPMGQGGMTVPVLCGQNEPAGQMVGALVPGMQ